MKKQISGLGRDFALLIAASPALADRHDQNSGTHAGAPPPAAHRHAAAPRAGGAGRAHQQRQRRFRRTISGGASSGGVRHDGRQQRGGRTVASRSGRTRHGAGRTDRHACGTTMPWHGDEAERGATTLPHNGHGRTNSRQATDRSSACRTRLERTRTVRMSTTAPSTRMRAHSERDRATSSRGAYHRPNGWYCAPLELRRIPADVLLLAQLLDRRLGRFRARRIRRPARFGCAMATTRS